MAKSRGKSTRQRKSPERVATRPPTPERRLRVYALDPSIAKSLSSVAVNETVLSVPWDDGEEHPLRPGPVGEYLEVMDYDPASDKIYDPVDLNNKELLAQDGWPPSEGNPQFHQQMVYAVAMTTIRHFERALGRRALWAPYYREVDNGKGKKKLVQEEVPRLRLYPHALRTDNAYYSPEKKALLFGYFPAESQAGDVTAPGSMVFSCLSSDIVAHEMSHALLDGLHRRFEEASNPDVPAFHEAFADIVALFQHFTVIELVRFEIARARGKLSAAGLLSGLAKQFGEGTRGGGPLRNYDPTKPPPLYTETPEAHDRGTILVFAIYEAFLNIVERRTEDLIRLATGGTGVLPHGALHPDLIERLTVETSKAAKHVLQMCVRALDYCPPVDITFGEYLRALITADMEVVSNDRYGYRVAVMEAFRKYAILPRDVRTISPESLAWNALDEPRPPWLRSIIDAIHIHWNGNPTRSEIFKINDNNCKAVHEALDAILATDRNGDKKIHRLFGLAPDVPRYDRNGQESAKPAPGRTTFEVHNVRPARRVTPDGEFRTDIIIVINQRQAVPVEKDGQSAEKATKEDLSWKPPRKVNLGEEWFWFRGGVTLVIDARAGQEAIRFNIVKNSRSADRLARQRKTAAGSFVSPMRALYFGKQPGEPFAMMHASWDEGQSNGY